MDNKIQNLFSTPIGDSVYNAIEKAVSEHNMMEKIKKGVLVGLSGGADSVMLLLYLAELRKRHGSFQILAVHINHMIRGDEADRDEQFSKEISEKLGIQFVCSKIDVPQNARESGLSLEEAARNVRYSEFQRIIDGRSDISYIALAHNATDNIETVILNILRGSGTRGASGIPPIRDNIVRPLILLPKKEIVSALDFAGIKYMTDSTNASDDYSRNFVRNNIVPHLGRLTCDPEQSFSRLSRNLRCDEDYIFEQAEKFLCGRSRVKTVELASLHKSLLQRVLNIMASDYSIRLSGTNVDAIYNKLGSDNFSIDLSGGIRFISECGISYITDVNFESVDYIYFLGKGKNEIDEFHSDLFLTDEKVNKSSLNVYKKFIQVDLSSAIICGRLFVRPKQDGDSMFYGGMTRKLKKLFNDRKIPVSQRRLIPILCDDKGIVWVPGCGVRDDNNNGSHGSLHATLAIRDSDTKSEYTFCFAENYKQSVTDH